MAHPLFGLFAEPASTLLVTAQSEHVSEIEELAGEYSFNVVRLGTTGGSTLEISVDHQPFISASLTALSTGWAQSLEAKLHDEVPA